VTPFPATELPATELPAGELPATELLAADDGARLDILDDTRALALDLVLTSTRLVRLVSSQLDIPLSLPQSRALAELREHGALRISVLAKSQRCSQPSMTTLVDRLEAAGYVTRSTDPTDARAVLVDITPTGLETVARAGEAIAEALAEPLAHLTRDERAEIARSLDSLRHVTAEVRSTSSR
jgi:DNA-binding MarR family transcriptional regulator